ncbi:potassium channel family protein [Bacillus solitudinis]|uniref:potassium channel family protein n=1 Tax=Bacillus solitudinis TaxID=2014074 RepID=UPI001D0D18D3|nr:potassium channel family protein [Bacillus solitudinis]
MVMISMLYFILLAATIGIVASFLLLIHNRPIVRGGQPVSLRHFLLLVTVYVTVTFAFSILYIGLELLDIHVLTEGNQLVGGRVSHLIEDAIYFSAVTMLSVGYGDIVPIGAGRVIAIVQAMFGFLLPAAFVVTIIRK